MHKQDRSIVLPVEDDLIHTIESPFCNIDPTCRCDEDRELLASVTDAFNDGYLTPYETSLIITGNTL
jgi:hypothetical protein